MVQVRRAMASDGEELGLDESLPPCRVCARADMYVIGHHDFSEEIAQREEEERKRRLKERGASICIQRSYRNYLRR